MRFELMYQPETLIRDKQWTLAESAQVLGIPQSRFSDLIRGKFEKFSLYMPITLATRTVKEVELKLAARFWKIFRACPVQYLLCRRFKAGRFQAESELGPFVSMMCLFCNLCIR